MDPQAISHSMLQRLSSIRMKGPAEACAPIDKPALRQTLETLKRETEQAIDIYTPDEVTAQGFDAAAKAKAAGLVQAFRDYLAQNKAQIDALQILYSRPYKQRLTESMLKELEKKLRNQHDYSPFSQRGGLSKAHQLFGEQLPKLLDELNEVLAA